MPYRTPFDETNEMYKNKTGPYAMRPSAPPSALDLKIAEYAAKALEKLQQQVNPVNNVREVDRRSAQVAAQNKSFLGARTDFSPTPGYTPEKGAFSVPKGTFTSPRGTFTPPKGAFAPSDYSPSDYSPTTDYSPTPINKDISTAAQKVIAPLKSLFQTPQSVQEQNAFNRVMGLRTSAEDPNFRGVNAQRARDAQGPGLTPEARATAGRYNLFADPAGEVKSGSIHNMNAPTGELKGPLPFLKMIGERAFRPGPEDTEASLLEMVRAERAGGNTGTANAAAPPASEMRTSPNQRTGMEPQLRTGPRPDGTITSPGAVDDKTTTRTPTDQGEQVGTQKAGTTFNGSTAPSTGNRYAEMIAAGPEAQAKFIKDANLVHMIRGTNQTWGNPKIQGDLGVKEFKSALEAAAGIDAQTALSQDAAAKDRAAELKKTKIAATPQGFDNLVLTDALTNQQSVESRSKATGQPPPEDAAAAAAEERARKMALAFNESAKNDAQKQAMWDFFKQNKKQQKLLKELIPEFSNL